MNQQTFDKSWKVQADQLKQRIVLQKEQQQNEQALPLAEHLFDLTGQHMKEDPQRYLHALDTLSGLYKETRHYAKAEPLYQQALEIRQATLGEQHPDVAASLNNLGLLYEEIGDYAKAEPLYQQALEIWRTALGEQHPNVAAGLNNLAALYAELRHYAKAQPLYQQALEIWQTALGKQHPRVANSLNNLAALYKEMGDYAKAEPLYQQALEIRQATLGEQHPDVAASLDNLAALYKEMGDYAKAEPLYQQALKIYQATQGEQHPDVANSLNNLGVLYAEMGHYAKAEPLLQQALKISQATLGEQHPDVAANLNNLAAVYEKMGNYVKAEPLLQQALEIRQATLSVKHPDVATSLDNLGLLYEEMGDYSKAEPLYQQALEIRQATLSVKHPDIAHSLNSLGLLYEKMGDYAKAEPLYQQALKIFQDTLSEKHPRVATILDNLGRLYEKMGDYAKAEPLYQQALEIRQATLGEQHPDGANSLNNLAALYQEVGHYAKAEPLLQQALKISQATLGEQHPDVATILDNLAALYEKMGDYAKAEPLYQQALKIFQDTLGERHPDVAINLNNLAELYGATNRSSDAWSLVQLGNAIDDHMIGQIFSFGSDRQRMAYLATLRWHIVLFLSLVLQRFAHTTTKVQAAFDLILRRKAIGAEALAVQRDALLEGRYPHLHPSLQRLIDLRVRLAQKTLAGPGSERPEEYIRTLTVWNDEKEQLETELASQIPEMNLELQLRRADRRALAAKLPRGSALIEFVRIALIDFSAVREEQRWKADRYLAFLLLQEEPDHVEMVDLGNAEPIDRMISAFRVAITTRSLLGADRHVEPAPVALSQTLSTDDGSGLRALIFDPLLAVLGDRKRLFLAPDGDLSRLPFEVLPSSTGGRLIDAYHFSYLSVGRDALRFGVPLTGQPGKALIAADPAFDLESGGKPIPPAVLSAGGNYSRDLDRSTLRFNPLPGTRVEARQLAALLNVKPLLGEKVLEQSLKAACSPSPRILHLATHGFFLEDQPRDLPEGLPGSQLADVPADDRIRWISQQENPLLRSGLALSGANTWLLGHALPPEAEDGLLTAVDVSGLDLSETELVVLSACETGLGEVHVGEGVFGLQRAFTLAGARRLVMSLWQVPDQQTQELMVLFYRNVLKGHSCGEALREAQLEMKAKEQNPYYWGAFIFQGDPGPLAS